MDENKNIPMEINDAHLEQASGGTTFNIRCRHCGYTAAKFNSRIDYFDFCGKKVPKSIAVCPSCGKDA